MPVVEDAMYNERRVLVSSFFDFLPGGDTMESVACNKLPQ